MFIFNLLKLVILLLSYVILCLSLYGTNYFVGRKEGNVLFNDALNTF